MQLLWCLIIAFLLTACAPRIEPAKPAAMKIATRSVVWPHWEPVGFAAMPENDDALLPDQIPLVEGEISTYGPRPDGSEHFAVISKREKNTKPGIFQLRLCFLPTSILAGPSPLEASINRLRGPGKDWIYPVGHSRSTFFDLYPATSSEAKGLLVYHTSIMMLSSVERVMITKLRRKGWNVMVALPPDSLYRTKLPALTSAAGNIRTATALIAEDMDHHYAEQAYTTRAALAYLQKTRPSWLAKKRVLMGTSVGTFGLPAEVLMNPDWDSIVIVSGGTNLLSVFESGAAKVFTNALDWVAAARKDPPREVMRIFTDEEYHRIYRKAATLTKLHAGALAPALEGRRILMISGTLDRVLPGEQMEEYHRALGHPERWTYPLGHHLVAVALACEVNRLDRWLMAR